MRTLRAESHKRMPWKNGGGETAEIAVFPEGAGLSDFDWRVSMARVDGDGTFSSFPGIDRTLAILEGAGIVLDVAGNPARRLTAEDEPHFFPADQPTSAALIGGSVLDFNVMSRRGRVAHSVREISTPISAAPGGLRLVFAASGSLHIRISGADITLERHDAALLDTVETALITPAGGGRGYLVTFAAETEIPEG